MVCIVAVIAVTHVTAQTAGLTLTQDSKKAAVEKISSLLIENYVFLDVADRCAKHIKSKFEAGAFDSITANEEFAKSLTTELQSISKDKHMRVRRRQPDDVRNNEMDPSRTQYRALRRSADENYGFRKVEILDGNIGYIDMRYFAPTEAGRETAIATMKFLANTDAIIFDMRNNGGGNPDMIRLICSYFFDKPTHLNSLYYRKRNVTNEFWTLDRIEGKRRPDVPLFVLTSKRTFSGAEEFSYNMQTQKRALLIGEVTGGGANPGEMMPVNQTLGIFVPTGRAINPVTGTNWEGIGVRPEIEIDASKAYDIALERAKKAAEEYHRQMEDTAVAVVSKAMSILDKAREMFRQNMLQEGDKLAQEALDTGMPSGILNESSINDLGYKYLGEGQKLLALAIFKYNVEKHPASSNAYDSLAEGHMENGQNELAIKFYRKSLELDPRNENARTTIRKLGGEVK